MSSWQNITDEREKYAAYLCSREWAEKREAVRERAGNRCERCELLPMDACHHLTYERKYNENLEDLQSTCTPCHEFTHGKSSHDPVAVKSWLDYAIACKDDGKTTVGSEWATYKEDGEGKFYRHPLQRAIEYLHGLAEDARWWRDYRGANSTRMVSECWKSMHIIEDELSNVGMCLWLEHGRPNIHIDDEIVCRKWVGYEAPSREEV